MALNIKVIAPDRTVWDANAEEVILPSSTGQLGILSGHAPLLTALDIGVMRVRIEKEWTPIVLMGGFAEVENNKLTILVNGAEEISDINSETVQENLDKAISDLESADSSKAKIEATQNLRKARARLQAINAISLS
uniref:ATP synthase CF1 epsilon subunit n=1 Tax=Pulvinaster venetus TaxID=427767 RepID=UPI001FCCF82A|nr:ATP synthase CF1 epsilon subunit [Pulvinaster venetus]UNJ16881.1 ATP synthase CF1 epsilon subunit [Pulvinaster venetus]